MKLCRKCGTEKPLDQFYNDNVKGGKRSACKQCQNEHVKRWYAAHPERKKEISRKWNLVRVRKPGPKCPTCGRGWGRHQKGPETADTPQPLIP